MAAERSTYPGWLRFTYGAGIVFAAIVAFLAGITLACPRSPADIVYLPVFFAVYSFIWLPLMATAGIFVMVATGAVVRSRLIDGIAIALPILIAVIVFVDMLHQPHPCRGGW